MSITLDSRLVISVCGDTRTLDARQLDQQSGVIGQCIEQSTNACSAINCRIEGFDELNPAQRQQVYQVLHSFGARLRLQLPGTAPDLELFAAFLSAMVGAAQTQLCQQRLQHAIEIAAVAHAADPPIAAGAIVERLRQLGVSGYTRRSITDRIRRAASNSAGTESVDPPGVIRVGDVLLDAPVGDALVPPQWHLSDGGIGKDVRHRSDLLPVPAPVIISKLYREAGGGREFVQLAWKSANGWETRDVSALEIATKRELVKLAQYGLPVTDNNASILVQFLAEYRAVNADTIPVEEITAKLGWQPDAASRRFLFGTELLVPSAPDTPVSSIRFRGADTGDAQIATAYHRKGSYAEWRAIVRELGALPSVQLGILGALATPLLSIVKSPNFVISYAGQTSTGKTTALKAIASVWGAPDLQQQASALGTWDASRVWIERVLGILDAIPLVLDDTKRARRPQDIAQTMYDVTSGRGRGRGSVDGVVGIHTWSTVLIASGEAPICSFTEDGGTRSRVIEVWGSPLGGTSIEKAALANRISDQVLNNYGHAGPLFVQYLIDHQEQWETWQVQLGSLRARYRNAAPGNAIAGRLAEHIAVLSLVARLAHDAGILPWGGRDAAAELWPQICQSAAESDRPAEALRMIISWASSNRRRFHQGTSNLHFQLPTHVSELGRWDDSGPLCVFRSELEQQLRSLRYSPSEIIAAWHERGWLQCDADGQRRMKSVSVGGKRVRLYAITVQAMASVEGSEGIQGEGGQ